jgi:putative redox protein
MPRELSIHAVHHGEMQISAGTEKYTIRMDYPAGPTQTGLTPLEVLLVSLAGCSANTVAMLLQKMSQTVLRLEVNVSGVRRDKHPTVFEKISLEFVVSGRGIQTAAVQRAIQQSEQHLCPVWAMLKGGTAISSSFRILETSE